MYSLHSCIYIPYMEDMDHVEYTGEIAVDLGGVSFPAIWPAAWNTLAQHTRSGGSWLKETMELETVEIMLNPNWTHWKNHC